MNSISDGYSRIFVVYERDMGWTGAGLRVLMYDQVRVFLHVYSDDSLWCGNIPC